MPQARSVKQSVRMKLSLATRIFLGYAAVLVTFGAVSLFSVAEMHRNQQEIRLISEGYLKLSQVAANLESLNKNEQQDAERIRDEPRADRRRAFIHLARFNVPSFTGQALAAHDAAEALVPTVPKSERAFMQELAARFGERNAQNLAAATAAEAFWSGLASEAPDEAWVKRTGDAYLDRLNGAARDLRGLRVLVEKRVRDQVEQAERRERRTGIAIITLSLLAIGVGLLATAWSARSLRPVRTLIAGVSRIGRGDYSAQLGVRGDDEISVLAREFDQMARSLRDREAQLKEKQEALLRAEQLAAVGRISAQIAHEVRNPLSSIGLNVELLEEAFAKATFATVEEARESRDILASVMREVDRLTEVTDQYLRMARLPNPSLLPEDLNAVLHSVLDFSRAELDRARVEVVRELDPSVPPALADEGQLRQVFLNLVRNSREAMSGGGTLTVRSRVSAQGLVEVQISDSGGGISGDAVERLFEPFYSTKSGGTGLGLALSRQILQAHGGSIDLDAPGNPAGPPASGTTFVIRLPRA